MNNKEDLCLSCKHLKLDRTGQCAMDEVEISAWIGLYTVVACSCYEPEGGNNDEGD